MTSIRDPGPPVLSPHLDGSPDGSAGSTGTSGLQSDNPDSPPGCADNQEDSKTCSDDGMMAVGVKAEPHSPVSLRDVLKLSGELGRFGDKDWATKVQEWQTAEQLARMRDDEPLVKNGGDRKFGDLCVVCGDKASGRHYGAVSCEGCKGFFKRSIRKQLGYSCRGNRDCEVTKHHRNRCQYCRLQKCLNKGMRADSVQSERKPADSREKLSTPPMATGSQRVYDNNINAGKADFNALCRVVAMKHMESSQVPLVLSNGQNQTTSSKETQKAFDSMVKITGGCTDQMSLPLETENDSLFELDGPLLLESHVAFHLTTPNLTPTGSSYLNMHYICESGSRLLFLSIHWARSIPAFQLLPTSVQSVLVRNCWSELFTLGLAQCSEVMSLKSIISAIINHMQSTDQQDRLTPARCELVTGQMSKLQSFVQSLIELQVDEHEYAYLRSIVLFSPDHFPHAEQKQIKKFQDKGVQELRSYICQTFPEHSNRFSSLLLSLRTLRSLLPSITEDLFFSGLIGNVQIDSIIPYILNMDSSEYTPESGAMAALGWQSTSE